ncbi:MAG: carbohydrate-binding domain-containing protein, partial [Clostridia bacterium]|nr:carbohydrate-binding domain-containing protein [Clostridia bacterium]
KIMAAVLTLVTVFALAACRVNTTAGSGSEPEQNADAASAATGYTGQETSFAEEQPETYEAAGATSFVFSDSGIEVTEGDYAGYSADGTALSIKESGVYIVSGSCANGSIAVKKNVTGVTLVLNGLKLSASATAPVTCGKGSEVKIFAAEGSVNDLADDKYNNDDNYTDEELYPDIENAVIKCKDGSNVLICGTGTVNVEANGKNGVKGGYDLYKEDEDGEATDELVSEASLTIKEVTLNIVCNANDALKSDKVLNLLSGNITVSSADDGIKSDYTLNIGAEGTRGPTVTVEKAAEGIEAATLNVYSGNIKVNASDDGFNAANSDLQDYAFSYNQYGGYVWVNVTAGDGIDSNGSINLNGGILEVYAPSQGDGDPLDSESGTVFNGATVLAVGHLGMQQRYDAQTPYVEFGGMQSGKGGFPGGQRGAQSAQVSAGSELKVCGADGSVLYTAEAVRSASYVLFSSPALENGAEYTLTAGGEAAASASAATGTAGGFGPGRGGFPGEGGRPGEDGGRGFSEGRGDGFSPPDGSLPEPPDGSAFPEIPGPPENEVSL